MVTPQTTWSVSAGTGGVRTVSDRYVEVTGRLARSVQYCQPSFTSWRNIVTTEFGVVVVYQTVRSYWWVGVTFGAQDGFSAIRALRSPLLIEVRLTCMARDPLCAAE